MIRLVFCLLALMATAVVGQEKPTFVAGPPAYAVPTQPLALLKGDGTIVLRNRGIMVSKVAHPAGAKLECSWTWLEGQEEGKYQDHLAVAVLTDGKQRQKWSHELQHGVVIRFNPGGGTVGVEGWLPDAEPEVLKLKEGQTFKKDVAYTIVIDYSLTEVTVSVDGEKLLTVAIPEKYRGGDKIAFYNREAVAGIPKVSSVKVEAITKK